MILMSTIYHYGWFGVFVTAVFVITASVNHALNK